MFPAAAMAPPPFPVSASPWSPVPVDCDYPWNPIRGWFRMETRKIPIRCGVSLIGNKRHCHIVIDKPRVSEYHTVLIVENDTFILTSSLGQAEFYGCIAINNDIVMHPYSYELKNNDVVKIGSATCIFNTNLQFEENKEVESTPTIKTKNDDIFQICTQDFKNTQLPNPEIENNLEFEENPINNIYYECTQEIINISQPSTTVDSEAKKSGLDKLNTISPVIPDIDSHSIPSGLFEEINNQEDNTFKKPDAIDSFNKNSEIECIPELSTNHNYYKSTQDIVNILQSSSTVDSVSKKSLRLDKLNTISPVKPNADIHSSINLNTSDLLQEITYDESDTFKKPDLVCSVNKTSKVESNSEINAGDHYMCTQDIINTLQPSSTVVSVAEISSCENIITTEKLDVDINSSVNSNPSELFQEITNNVENTFQIPDVVSLVKKNSENEPILEMETDDYYNCTQDIISTLQPSSIKDFESEKSSCKNGIGTVTSNVNSHSPISSNSSKLFKETTNNGNDTIKMPDPVCSVNQNSEVEHNPEIDTDDYYMCTQDIINTLQPSSMIYSVCEKSNLKMSFKKITNDNNTFKKPCEPNNTSLLSENSKVESSKPSGKRKYSASLNSKPDKKKIKPGPSPIVVIEQLSSEDLLCYNKVNNKSVEHSIHNNCENSPKKSFKNGISTLSSSSSSAQNPNDNTNTAISHDLLDRNKNANKENRSNTTIFNVDLNSIDAILSNTKNSICKTIDNDNNSDDDNNYDSNDECHIKAFIRKAPFNKNNSTTKIVHEKLPLTKKLQNYSYNHKKKRSALRNPKHIERSCTASNTKKTYQFKNPKHIDVSCTSTNTKKPSPLKKSRHVKPSCTVTNTNKPKDSELSCTVKNSNKPKHVELSCTATNSNKHKPLELSSTSTNTNKPKHVEPSCTVKNSNKPKHVELSCTVTNTNKPKHVEPSCTAKNTNKPKDAEVSCTATNSNKHKPLELSSTSTNTNKPKHVDPSCTAKNTNKPKDAELSCTVTNTNKPKHVEPSCTAKNTNKPKDAEVSCTATNSNKHKPLELSSTSTNTNKPKHVEHSCTAKNTTKPKDAELLCTATNLSKPKHVELSCTVTNTNKPKHVELSSTSTNTIKPSPLKNPEHIELSYTAVPNVITNLPEKRRACKQRFLLTSLSEDENKEAKDIIEKLCGQVVDNFGDICVTTTIRRTSKIFITLSCGKPIVGMEYLRASFKKNIFLNPMDYLLQDENSKERHNFDINYYISHYHKILTGYIIYITPSIKYKPCDLKDIVENLGGKAVIVNNNFITYGLKTARKKKAYTVSCIEDKNLYKNLPSPQECNFIYNILFTVKIDPKWKLKK